MNATRNCSVDECSKPHFGKGYCNTHYYRLRRNGSLELKSAEQIKSERLASSPRIVCKVADCERYASRICGVQRVCGMHGKRFDRHGTFDTVRVFGAPNPDKGKCSVNGCDSTQDGNADYCKMHDTRFRRHGDPLVVIPHKERDFLTGEAHPNWTSDASYSAVHQRVRYNRGSASEHRCFGCGEEAAQWAYQHGSTDERRELIDGNLAPYSLNIFDYEPMCVKCHKTFDMERIRNEKKKKDRLLT